MGKIQVLIVDDHKVVRLGLSQIVVSLFPESEISQAGNATEVFALIPEKKFDLILMDLRMPDTDSLSLVEQLLLTDPTLKILIVSLMPEKVFALRHFQMGVLGYVQKSADEEIIKNAILKVLSGKRYMSDEVLEQMANYLQEGNTFSTPFNLLAKREMEVVTKLIEGLSTSDISNVMNLQPSTISTFKNRIFEKLGVQNVHELIQLAKQYGLGDA